MPTTLDLAVTLITAPAPLARAPTVAVTEPAPVATVPEVVVAPTMVTLAGNVWLTMTPLAALGP